MNAGESVSVSSLVAQLKKCSRSSDLKRGIQLHSQVIVSGNASHIYIVNSLINMYSKCGRMVDARRVFDQQYPNHDIVSWNSLISGYSNNGESELSLEIFECIGSGSSDACFPNARTFVAALSACATLAARQKDRKLIWFQKGKRIHARAVTNRCCDGYVQSTLVDFYAKCGRMVEARDVFDKMISPDVVAWNSLLQGYVDNSQSELALEVFEGFSRCCDPDARTFVAALSATANLATELGQRKCLMKGEEIHAMAVNNSCCDIFVENTLIDMYAKCGSMKSAREVFDGMIRRDAVSWTCLMKGYVEGGESELALKLFDVMEISGGCFRDARTYVVALSACTALAAKQREDLIQTSSNSNNNNNRYWFQKGKSIHLQAVNRKCCDIFVENKLVDLYAECGFVSEASIVFDKMVRRDVVSWTALATGYVKNGANESALEVIDCMEADGVGKNSLTYAAALMACGNLMAEERGEAFHAEIQSSGLEQDVLVANCLVDFYGKCGSMDSAKQVFDSVPRKTTVSWTTLMCGYSLQGDAERVLEVFEEMKECGMAPNEATLVCVLTACSHGGLTDKGREFFRGLCLGCYGAVRPTVKHYACVVDLLGRANCLDEALKVVRSMPCEADVVIWKAVLGACEKWKNVIVGRIAYEALLKLNSEEDAAYVLMARIYKGAGLKEECDCVLASDPRLIRTPKRSAGTSTCWTDESGKPHRFVRNY